MKILSLKTRLNSIRSLKETFSPLSLIYQSIAATAPAIVLLRPSVIEFMVTAIFDHLVTQLVIRLEWPLFLKAFPDASLFFPEVEEEKIKRLGSAEKVALYRSMSRFPIRRGVWVFVNSYYKMIPAWLLVIFWWDYDWSMQRQALVIIMISTVVNIFSFQALFVESHIFLSNLIKRLHRQYNWREVFLSVPISELKRQFENQEKMNLTMLFLMMLVLQGIVISTGAGQSPWALFSQVLTVGLLTLMVLARAWSLGRQYIFGGLADLFAAMDTVDYSDQNSVLPLHTAELLAKFERSFNELVARLQQSEQELVGRATREAEKSAQLTEKQRQLRRLTAELAAVEARERRRIAEDLHDSVCQTLAMCVAQLKNLQGRDDPACPTGELDEIRAHLDQTIAETRTLTYELSPPVLYDFGIEAALEWLAENVSARHPLKVTFEDGGPPVALDDNLKAILYRSARELLFNAVKHARAREAVIRVSAPDAAVRIEVADDGVGFDPTVVAAQSTGGFGLFSIRERLEPLGGSLVFHPRPEAGTLAVMTVPLKISG